MPGIVKGKSIWQKSSVNREFKNINHQNNEMKFSLLCLSPFLLLCSCLHFKPGAKKTLTGTWQLYDAEPLTGESGGSSFSEQASLKQLVKEGEILSFFKDGTYTELKGQTSYNTGKYNYKEKNGTLQFLVPGKRQTSAEVKFETSKKDNPVLVLKNSQQSLVLKFIKTAETKTDFHDLPFYAENNQWRVKPAAPENEEQQTARLMNYLKHVALILKSAKEEKQDVVSFAFSQGPIRIYNGGIGIHSYEIVPATWKQSYYNEADALSAYHLYEHYLRTNSYRGSGTGDWVEDDYNILLSIYGDFQRAHPTH